HLAEAFVPDDEHVMAVGGGAVLRSVDLLVRAVDADPEDLHENAAAPGDVVDRWLRQIGEVDAVGLARKHRDGFHGRLPPECWLASLLPVGHAAAPPGFGRRSRAATAGGRAA